MQILEPCASIAVKISRYFLRVCYFLKILRFFQLHVFVNFCARLFFLIVFIVTYMIQESVFIVTHMIQESAKSKLKSSTTICLEVLMFNLDNIFI